MPCPRPKTEPPAGGGGCVGLWVCYLDGSRGDEVEYSEPESQGGTNTDLGVRWAEANEDWSGSRGDGTSYCCMETIFDSREDMDLVD